MDKPRNVKHGTSRFSNANKRRRHVNKLFGVFGGNIQFSEKSKKGEKVRSLSAVSTSLSQMGCCHVSEKQAHEPAKRFKIPNNFLNDCIGVYHASVPRKLRSAMKKRSRESNLFDSEKVNHKINGIESPKKDSVKKSKVNIKQGISQKWSPREGVSVSGPITKDEEEVAETLYALAEMFPHSGSNHISRELVGESLPANSSVLQDLKENAIAALEASATGQVANPYPDEEASKVTCLNGTISPTINLQTTPRMVKPENCNNVALHDSELYLAMGQSWISQSERKPDVKLEAARDVDSKPKQHTEEESLALWPGLSTVASAGEAYQKPFATEAPDWLEAATRASKHDLMETSTCSSSGKISEAVITHKRSWKRCAAHVHISHIIRSLELPKKGVIKESELHECHQMRAQEESKPGVFFKVHNLNRMGNGITCATVRNPHESKNGILQQQCHYHGISQAAPTPGVYGHQKQSFNFLSLSAGSYGVKVDNNHNNTGSRLEPLSKLQVPYFQSLAQQQRVMPIPTTLYLDQLTVVGSQLRLQQPHYYSSTVTNKQEHQNFWGMQQGAQGRPSENCNIMRTQHPNWQNGRHDSSAMSPCAQAIFPHSPASQEIFGSRITSISGQQHHLIPHIQDIWARSSPIYMRRN